MAEKTKFNRREFLKILGAGTGMAAAGCGKELPEKIIPYVIQPNEIVPGVAAWYAGSCGECSAGCGVLVRVRDGRAVKLEGNPNHPVSQGALCALGQSSIQSHYDPDRVREPLLRKNGGPLVPVSWDEALKALAEQLKALPATDEVAVLTQPLSGSTEAIVSEFVAKNKKARHVEQYSAGDGLFDLATEQCFGAGYTQQFDFSKADVIVGFGADYLETWRSPVEYSRQWASRRSLNAEGMSYVMHFEPRLSLTAANADRWVQNAPGREADILLVLLDRVLAKNVARGFTGEDRVLINRMAGSVNLHDSGITAADIDKLAARLVKAKSSLVVAGGAATLGEEALLVSVLANALNVTLGNMGRSAYLISDRKTAASSDRAMKQLIADMAAKKIGLALISGINPAYSLSPDSGLAAGLSKVRFVVSLASQLDETTTFAHLVLPLSSSLESWSDAEPAPGVHNLNQPAMAPLYQSQSLGDALISLGAKSNMSYGADSFYDYIRNRWKSRTGGNESTWTRFVERGGDWSAADKSRLAAGLRAGALNIPRVKGAADGITLVAYPSVTSRDGSSANRPWMQELPNPMTTVVWGSWVEMHPDTAARLGITKDYVVRVQTKSGAIEAPVFITRFAHPNLVAVPLGQGHEGFGRYANGVGTNAFAALSFDGGYQQLAVSGADVRATIVKDPVVFTQGHDSQEGRNLIHSTPLSALLAKKEHTKHHHEPKQMYVQQEHTEYRWGMSVDMAACTGCSACVVACYAENNIAVVGKRLIGMGREMSWIRMDRYFDGPAEQPLSGFQPMMCQQCGNAPCEPVCPVYATYHNEEGINAMIYNRCVGTRYCANNCSYKVRRFNWFAYEWPEPLNMQLNPDITVREVGVMEKCNFCWSRISAAKNVAKNEGRMVKEGEIQPACVSTCPTKALTFGNLKDHNSAVYKNSQDVRAYKVLDHELNTQPAISYLARVRNDIGEEQI